jgi:hypothetical protein
LKNKAKVKTSLKLKKDQKRAKNNINSEKRNNVKEIVKIEDSAIEIKPRLDSILKSNNQTEIEIINKIKVK